MLVDGATISDGGDNPVPFSSAPIGVNSSSSANMPRKVIEMIWPVAIMVV